MNHNQREVDYALLAYDYVTSQKGRNLAKLNKAFERGVHKQRSSSTMNGLLTNEYFIETQRALCREPVVLTTGKYKGQKVQQIRVRDCETGETIAALAALSGLPYRRSKGLVVVNITRKNFLPGLLSAIERVVYPKVDVMEIDIDSSRIGVLANDAYAATAAVVCVHISRELLTAKKQAQQAIRNLRRSCDGEAAFTAAMAVCVAGDDRLTKDVGPALDAFATAEARVEKAFTMLIEFSADADEAFAWCDWVKTEVAKL